MDPFYNDRRFYYQPSLNRRHYPYAVPARHSDPTRQPDRHPPKVVQIPIRFVGSKEHDRSDSALKIQKVFRGFLVRKCVKKIREIESRVDEIEAKLRSDGGLETVRGDEKERLWMIEGLMSLLFKLDSIKGFDLGVRAYRKAVTRRVIALQEVIDSIAAAVPLSSNGENADAKDDVVELDRNHEGDDAAIDDGRSGLEGISVNSENSPAIDSTETCRRRDDEDKDSTMSSPANSSNPYVCVHGEVSQEMKTESDILEHRKKDDESNSKDEDEDHSKREDRELLERIMGDNEKMMKMLTQLCEKNESQSKMITALAHRVELLEKVFVCERLRKIKKNCKKGAATPCQG